MHRNAMARTKEGTAGRQVLREVAKQAQKSHTGEGGSLRRVYVKEVAEDTLSGRGASRGSDGAPYQFREQHVSQPEFH